MGSDLFPYRFAEQLLSLPWPFAAKTLENVSGISVFRYDIE